MRRSRPSRSSTAAAGWGCRRLGTFRDLLPGHARRLYWLNPIPLIRSRNDRLVKLFGDPTDDMRREWVARQARLGQSPDKIIDRYAGRDRISFVLLGDPVRATSRSTSWCRCWPRSVRAPTSRWSAAT